MKKYNFSAGPSILPDVAIEETIKALQNFAGTGLSLATISHRSKEFDKVMIDTQNLFKELLNAGDDYYVLFLGGGASLQFAMVPYNLMNKKAVYANTGTWAAGAIKEAKLFGEVVEIKAEDYFKLPKEYNIPADADYFHITSNNTIFGTQFKKDFNVNIPVVADMSSDIFSRQIDVNKYGIIYGGAQKNLSMAGVTFVLIKKDILGKVDRKIPSMLNYQTHISKDAMYNTPPVVPIYTAYQTMLWIKANGGVAGMEKRAIEKANLLYSEIDRNPLFRGTVAVEDRSNMNICFVFKDEYKQYEEEFGKFASERGMVGIKGHRSVGGFRASTYNAMPLEGVKALVECMQEFENKKK
jgi:phosphoserine aminotransferase